MLETAKEWSGGCRRGRVGEGDAEGCKRGEASQASEGTGGTGVGEAAHEKRQGRAERGASNGVATAMEEESELVWSWRGGTGAWAERGEAVVLETE